MQLNKTKQKIKVYDHIEFLKKWIQFFCGQIFVCNNIFGLKCNIWVTLQSLTKIFETHICQSVGKNNFKISIISLIWRKLNRSFFRTLSALFWNNLHWNLRRCFKFWLLIATLSPHEPKLPHCPWHQSWPIFISFASK